MGANKKYGDKQQGTAGVLRLRFQAIDQRTVRLHDKVPAMRDPLGSL